MAELNATYLALVHTPPLVTISGDEAASIWLQFKPSSPLAGSTFEGNFKYKAFLQAAMICWVDGSNDIGTIQSLWVASVKPNATLLGIVKKLAKDDLKRYFKREIKKEPDLYESVRNQISSHPYFKLISNALELD